MKTILVTGGAGFIGSNLVAELTKRGTHRVVVCDRFGADDKYRNLAKHAPWKIIPPEMLREWLDKHKDTLECVFHTAAITSTTEKDIDLLLANNYELSLCLWSWCNNNNARFIYTSSAATYGNGDAGFDDDNSLGYLQELRPLSGYGFSKHQFDLHMAQRVAQKSIRVPQWVGLKVFNTYGPNEYHKGIHQSVITQMSPSVLNNGSVKLFRSYNPDYADGCQMRDMIYVKDVVKVMLWCFDNPQVNGLFNLGTGKARTFKDMAIAMFAALGNPPKMQFIEMPDGLASKYQYFTEAKMDRLRAAGYTDPFMSLEDGIKDYVLNYLAKDEKYL